MDTSLSQILLDNIYSPSYSNAWVNLDSEFVAEFDIPGFKREDVKIKTKSNILHLEVSSAKAKRSGIEVKYGFPHFADLSRTKAELDLGVLKITVPKKESEIPKEISIKVS
jgi:HSP20 family molecular chaperone IbpA